MQIKLVHNEKKKKTIYVIGYVDFHEDDAWVKLPGFSHGRG